MPPCCISSYRARKQLGDIFAKVIRERKARGAQEDDLLQVFIDAKYQRVHGGRGTTEQECTGLMIAGLFAGQHTSSVVSSWTGYYMIGHRVCAHWSTFGQHSWYLTNAPLGVV